MVKCLDEDARSNEPPKLIELPQNNCSEAKKAELTDFYNPRFTEEVVNHLQVVELAQCIDLSQAYLESSGVFSNFAGVLIEYEHCITRNHGAERDNCTYTSYAPDMSFHVETPHALHVAFKSIDPSNIDNPVISFGQMFQFATAANTTYDVELQLAPNEFFAYDNKVGILVQDPDPVQFLTIENKNFAKLPNEIITTDVIQY